MALFPQTCKIKQTTKHYYANFLDDAKQCAATSHENFYVQILDMIEKNVES